MTTGTERPAHVHQIICNVNITCWNEWINAYLLLQSPFFLKLAVCRLGLATVLLSVVNSLEYLYVCTVGCTGYSYLLLCDSWWMGRLLHHVSCRSLWMAEQSFLRFGWPRASCLFCWVGIGISQTDTHYTTHWQKNKNTTQPHRSNLIALCFVCHFLHFDNHNKSSLSTVHTYPAQVEVGGISKVYEW